VGHSLCHTATLRAYGCTFPTPSSALPHTLTTVYVKRAEEGVSDNPGEAT
jgi:hypothetical protein